MAMDYPELMTFMGQQTAYDTDQSSDFSKPLQQRPYNCNQPKSHTSFARSRANQLDKFFSHKNIKPHPQRQPNAQTQPTYYDKRHNSNEVIKHFSTSTSATAASRKEEPPLTPKLATKESSFQLVEQPVNNGSRVSRASITFRGQANKNYETNYFSDSEGFTNNRNNYNNNTDNSNRGLNHRSLSSNKSHSGVRRVINRMTGQQAPRYRAVNDDYNNR
jgi:hypothetical protein